MISIPEIVAKAKWEWGSFFSTEAMPTPTVINVLNQAIRKVCLAADWKFNDRTYDLTTNWAQEEYDIPFQIKTYWIKSWEDTYKPVSFEEYMMSDDAKNLREIWIKSDKLYTLDAKTFKIVYRWLPDRVTSTEWNVDMPDLFFDILLSAMVYYGYLHLKQYNRADKRVADFNNEVTRLRAIFTDQFPNEPVRISSNYNF